MSDLIERLRNVPDDHGMMYGDYDTVMEAADYITTLEAKLAVAREALEEAKEALSYAEAWHAWGRTNAALKEIEQ